MNKLEAICKFLDTDYSENSDDCAVNENYPRQNVYEYLNEEYLVLTDEEADDYCKEYILENLWAFTPNFLIENMDCINSSRMSSKDIEIFTNSLRKMQEEMCEACNPIIKSLVIRYIERLSVDAIAVDGRGHFLASYDGEENEEGEYFIYQIA